MDLKSLIFTLCEQSGTPGREDNVSDKICEKISEYANVSKDINGNVHAVMGNPDGKCILLDAHIDQIGLVVTKINEKGFLKVSPSGGMDMRIMNDTLFTVHGKEDIKAVVCCLPPHLSDGAEDTAVSADKLWLDTGMSYERISNLVEIGDSVTFAQKGGNLLGNRIFSPALDNRCCASLLIRCAELLKDSKLNCRVNFLFSSKEEVGGMGATTGSFIVKPDKAIVFDVSFASQCGVSSSESGELSKGPMLGLAPILDREIYNDLKALGEKYNIPTQNEVMGGRTGTNADNISISAGGIKTGLVSIPLRNMHTPAEVIDVDDIELTSQLIYRYITDVFDKEAK